MGRDRKDKAYRDGVEDGQKGGFFDDLTHNLSKSTNTTESDEIYDKGYKYGQEHRYDSNDESENSDSGCYLTTACVSARGLSDSCIELRVLRNFRDIILMKEPLARRAIKEYYKVAPEIVQSIREKDNSSKIWQSVYVEIRKAVSLVMSGDFEEAFNHYRQTTLDLKKSYL